MSEPIVGTKSGPKPLAGTICPRGDDGGYYTVQVSQDDTTTMRLSFTASEEGMEAIPDQVINLPQGPKGKTGPRGEKGDPGPAEVFIAEYGVTTYAELEAAYRDGKILFCRDGVYYSALYQRTSTGSYTFYSNDSASQVNRFCTSSGWGKKAVKLCAAAFEEMRDYIDGADAANKEYVDGIVGDIDSALDGIIAIQNGLIGGDGA